MLHRGPVDGIIRVDKADHHRLISLIRGVVLRLDDNGLHRGSRRYRNRSVGEMVVDPAGGGGASHGVIRGDIQP